MSYIALRDFDNFKKGDSIPEEIVEGRLIRGKKIGLAGSESVQEIKEELITEIVEEIKEEELLLEDSSDVIVEIKKEIVPEVQETTKETKKAKK